LARVRNSRSCPALHGVGARRGSGRSVPWLISQSQSPTDRARADSWPMRPTHPAASIARLAGPFPTAPFLLRHCFSFREDSGRALNGWGWSRQFDLYKPSLLGEEKTRGPQSTAAANIVSNPTPTGYLWVKKRTTNTDTNWSRGGICTTRRLVSRHRLTAIFWSWRRASGPPPQHTIESRGTVTPNSRTTPPVTDKLNTSGR